MRIMVIDDSVIGMGKKIDVVLIFMGDWLL